MARCLLALALWAAALGVQSLDDGQAATPCMGFNT